MSLARALANLFRSGPLVRDAAASRNLAVFASLLGPAYRGLVQQPGRTARSAMPAAHAAHFDWSYERSQPEMTRLYEAAKASQWNASVDLDWAVDVDPLSEEKPLLPDSFNPVYSLPVFQRLTPAERARQRHALTSWLLSQFLHGEQGALYAAAQVTEAVPWLDAKLYGASQVVDEGRHVEVFHRYLTAKLERLYVIDDNLYVLIDALMTDSRWDMKFLGMQILIEGLALGAFGMLRQLTREPLLKQLLTYVITDEARHVHYGVLALQQHFQSLGERERRFREDWTFEMAVLLRNRFLAYKFYDEHWAHALTRKQWEQAVLASELMGLFRRTMFKRIVPNLKRIGLLSERVRPKYQALGLLEYEGGKAAPELSAPELLDD
ncbi:MAG TPA: ferritin-like domain-containing protein [Myxococcaceae bacterium]|nr:ferritin-like domain-containing protein [Myxococcaceae bacterium]